MPSARATLSILAATTLTACSGYSLTVAATSCDLSQHQQLVGMNIGEVYLPPQLPRREISPGQVVTREYQPRRLNIFLDPKGWITSVTCG
ncbi:I78 family peptidase inhibitor [Paracoccus benzoatiresistens]|uniref:I78 family peptidase inhibitor n=1 Tax=Paracoccus benzoatiresistens TaxID=2997341 RepID=A0ABT4J3Y9_9RHOB|nr:I78 family peptidase inhibitor [Paracoccus sp. EF6]MCZ0961813.1 I78 family peptidase inhibitor [Paracoccus sp. EF6]